MTSNLPTLPASWEWKKLENVCTLINGRAYKKEELLASGKYPVLRVGNFFTNNNWYYSDLELPENKYCDDGDLLYAWSASFGPKIWTGEKAIYHYHIWKILPQEKAILKEFLYILLGWDVEQIKASQGTGTTMMHVTKGSMEARLIPLPPLNEQKRLVSLLDTLFAKIDRSIELLSENITASDALLPSALNTVFEELEEKYGTINLDKVTKFSQGIQVALNDQFDCYEEGLYKFLRIINYTQNSDDLRYIKQFSEKAYVQENDIVMVRYGATAGFVGKGLSGIIANNMFRVIPNDLFLNNFIYYTLTNPKNQEILYSNIGAAAMPAINFGTMSLLEIPNVDTTIQTQTVAYLDTIRHKVEILKRVQNDKITHLKALKASILDRAFKGEL